jgi:4-hydroxy-2-oxoheptanedioate aldolase
MRKNLLKEKLVAGETVLGTAIGVHSPDLVELLGELGLDYVTFDLERESVDEMALLHSIRATEAAGITPIVRLPNDADLIGRVLNAGAQGVHVPRVDDAEEAEDAVASARFYPDGDRSLSIASRAGDYGLGISHTEYITTSNAETLVTIEIEAQEGIENIGEILEVAGIDIVEIAPRDLWLSLGMPEQVQVEKVADGAIKKAVAAGKWVSSYVWLDETFDAQVKRLRALGVQMLTAPARDFVLAGARRFLTVRGKRSAG